MLRLNIRSFFGSRTKVLNLGIFLTLLIISVLIRVSVFGHQSGDYSLFLSNWFDFILNNGGWRALQYNFANYNLPYLYLLVGSAYVHYIFDIPKIFAIKLISVVFDYFLAYWVYRIVYRWCNRKDKGLNMESSQSGHDLRNSTDLINSSLPVVAFFSVLFSPNVLFNSAVWAQSDAIYTAFILASLFYIMKTKYGWAMFWYGVAFSFKLQAIFLAPVLLVLWLHQKINLYHFFIPVLVFFAGLLPAVLLGRTWQDLLSIYIGQANTYHQLSMNAPTYYQWFGNLSFPIFAIFGVLLALVVSLAIVFLFWKKSRKAAELDLFWLNLSYLVSVAVIYFLPKMHERYFFMADILSILFMFYAIVSYRMSSSPLWFLIISVSSMLLINLSSFFAYGFYISGFAFFAQPLLALVMFGVSVTITCLAFRDFNKIKEL